MAIDQGVLIAEVLGVLAVDEDGAVGIHLAAEQVVKVGEVIFRMGDGVVNHGVGAVDPAGGLRVLGLESGKVHIDGGNLHRFLLFLLTGSGGGPGRTGGHKLLGQGVIVLLRNPVASQGAYDLKSAESKHAEQYHAQQNQHQFNGFLNGESPSFITEWLHYNAKQRKRKDIFVNKNLRIFKPME